MPRALINSKRKPRQNTTEGHTSQVINLTLKDALQSIEKFKQKAYLTTYLQTRLSFFI